MRKKKSAGKKSKRKPAGRKKTVRKTGSVSRSKPSRGKRARASKSAQIHQGVVPELQSGAEPQVSEEEAEYGGES